MVTATDTVIRYKRALKYLDACGVLTMEKLREAQEIAGAPLPEAQLKQMWESASSILPSRNEPGGHEYLRAAMRKTLIEGINTFQELARLETRFDPRKKWWQFWK